MVECDQSMLQAELELSFFVYAPGLIQTLSPPLSLKFSMLCMIL